MAKPTSLSRIGSKIKINIERVRDRIPSDLIDQLSQDPRGTVIDYKMTDGRGGIGVVLKMNDGSKQWFFEDEIDLLDENGNVIRKIYDKQKNNSLLSNILTGLKYENKKNVSDLLNPINFFLWLVVSFKDIF